MGQGHYIALVYGEKRNDITDEQYGSLNALDYGEAPRTAYECTDKYVGFEVAATNGAGAVDLDDFGAVPIDQFAAFVSERYADDITDAKARWDAARAKLKWLGEGGLMLVADYD
jgi:hypothetical protein